MEGRADRGMVLVAFLLLLYGLVMVYSATAPFSLRHFHNDNYLFLKQLAAAGIGIVLLFCFSCFNYHRLGHLDDIFLVGSFFLTVMTVLPLPGVSNGRWLHLGSFAVQPTELLKFALIIYLAVTIERKKDRIKSFVDGILPFVIVLFMLTGIVMSQPDFGMTLLFAALTIVMLFLGGARVSHLALLVTGGLPFVYLAIRLAPYRLGRIVSFLNPQAYRTSSGYQIIQSMVAIGSGGIFGRGLGASQAKLFYLPQAHNDFIFSITAEELGLVGALVLVGLLIVFAWRAFLIAARAPDRLGTLLALGVGFTLFFQALLNLGVALGVLPVTGLTLPFISNGGSSLLVTLAMVGVLINISKQGKDRCEF